MGGIHKFSPLNTLNMFISWDGLRYTSIYWSIWSYVFVISHASQGNRGDMHHWSGHSSCEYRVMVGFPSNDHDLGCLGVTGKSLTHMGYPTSPQNWGIPSLMDYGWHLHRGYLHLWIMDAWRLAEVRSLKFWAMAGLASLQDRELQLLKVPKSSASNISKKALRLADSHIKASWFSKFAILIANFLQFHGYRCWQPFAAGAISAGERWNSGWAQEVGRGDLLEEVRCHCASKWLHQWWYLQSPSKIISTIDRGTTKNLGYTIFGQIQIVFSWSSKNCWVLVSLFSPYNCSFQS